MSDRSVSDSYRLVRQEELCLGDIAQISTGHLIAVSSAPLHSQMIVFRPLFVPLEYGTAHVPNRHIVHRHFGSVREPIVVIALRIGVWTWSIIVVDHVELANAEIGGAGPVVKDVVAEVIDGFCIVSSGIFNLNLHK